MSNTEPPQAHIPNKVNTVQTITRQHSLQTAQLQSLVEILFKDGCAPEMDPQNTVLQPNSDHDEDQEENEAEASHTAHFKRRALVRQRVLELWQSLPLLSDGKGLLTVRWLEDICSVEVGRWEEQ